jgi:hypothetical protein
MWWMIPGGPAARKARPDDIRGGSTVFSYADLVRTEVALEAEEEFGVTITDEELGGWRSLGDAARSVAGRAAGTVTEEAVFDWLRTLIEEGYGVSAELTPEEEMFSDYDRMIGWFFSSPYPHHLGGRLYARNKGKHPRGPTDAGPQVKS